MNLWYALEGRLSEAAKAAESEPTFQQKCMAFAWKVRTKDSRTGD